MSAAVAIEQVQQIVLHGLDLNYVRHYLLTVARPALARQFLGELGARNELTRGTAAVAVTYPGLQALQLRSEVLRGFGKFAAAFVQGAADRAATHLGDTGRNESPRWERMFRSRDTHILLSIYGDAEPELAENERQILGEGGRAGTGLTRWENALLGEQRGAPGRRTEPFGFRDGISQPRIRGVHARSPVAAMNAEPGEFFLAHRNDDGADPLSVLDLSEAFRAFVQNGSFGALRKMKQDKAAFARELASPLQQARACGRWPNGALVRAGEIAQPEEPTEAELNDFDYRSDSRGAGCPFGSHIRRLSPRSDPAVPPRKRLLIRRGVPYSRTTQVDDQTKIEEEGMLGLFICASLERQFEFLLHDWVRKAPMQSAHEGPDPLLSSFVTTRGTLYALYPSLAALRTIERFA
jgi:deferrochelatase/peroxidase EfeB